VKKLFGLSFIFALFMSVVTVSAQDDVFQVTYGETVNLTSNADGQQFFFQFEGVAGDLVYFTGVGEDAGGARFQYEIRDSVGRSVGVAEDFPIDAFTIAELPSDGLYTAVATSDASYSQTVDFTVQRTHFISADAVNVSVEGQRLRRAGDAVGRDLLVGRPEVGHPVTTGASSSPASA
jgi:hypothetical protein